MVVQGFSISFIQDIEPDEGFVQAVEEEAGEEPVLYAGHQIGNLLGRAGEDGGNTGLLDADVFPFRAAKVRDRLVLEALAKALGEVSEVLTEAGSKNVAFGLKEETLAFILVEGLIDGGGAAVGWDEEKADGRWVTSSMSPRGSVPGVGTDGFWEGDWGWSSHFWKKLSFSIGRDVFRVDVGLRIVGQEASTRAMSLHFWSGWRP